MNFKRQLNITPTYFGSCVIHHQGVLSLTEITRSGSQIFFVCFVGVWQSNFEPAVRGVFRPRQTRQLPRAVDLKGRLLSCQRY